MMDIAFVNMPFASLESPSLALTQLKSVMDKSFPADVVSVRDVIYLNHDIGHYLGLGVYEFMCKSGEAAFSGLGDWFFRQSAFPEAPDNSEVYFRRYFPVLTDELKPVKAQMLEKREGLDAFLDQLIDTYSLDRADVVGFTSMFWQNVACFALARRLKERNHSVLIVMGGSNCESPMGQEIVKHVPQVDYVFSGPALKSFPEFVEAVLAGEPERVEAIRGVFTKGNVAAPPSIIGEEVDIDTVIELDYDSFMGDIRNNFPNREVKPFLMFETSRGCWWGQKAHCTFCGLNGLTMNYRAMQPEKAITQINSLFRYAPECERYECVDNIMPTNYPTEVFPHLRTPTEASIFYEVKADLTAEEMQALSRARVKAIQPGIESLATSTLKLMKKGTTSFQNIAFLKNCLLYDLFPVWNILAGFPGEEEEVYEKYTRDIPSLVHLPPPNALLQVQFDRYSPYFTQAEQYGLNLQPFDYYTLIYPFGRESLSNLAYHFVDRNVSAKYIQTLAKWVIRLKGLVERWSGSWLAEGGQMPKLYLDERDGGSVVRDTREGELVEHNLSPLGRLVLGALERPKRVSQLVKDVEGAGASELEAEVAWLRERGLLFHETDRFLSLVLPRDTTGFSLNFFRD